MQHNDCTYISTEDTEIRQARYRYYQYIISEANLILNGSGGLLVFVRSPLDIDRYINEHPNQSRIGFIVEKPDCIKSMSLPEPDTHVSPIYFARDNFFYCQRNKRFRENYFIVLTFDRRVEKVVLKMRLLC
jgi:hypothetical protein